MVIRFVSTLLAVAALAPVALATDVIGNINTATRWTKTGSPYRLTGDVTVAPQATLTIEAGVEIVANATDTLGAGANTAKVEFVVRGTLVADGSASEPIVFRGAGAGKDTWVGITFEPGALASSLTRASVRDTVTAVQSRSANAVALSDVTIRDTSNGVSWATTKALSAERVEVTEFGDIGFSLDDGGAGGLTATLTACRAIGGATASTGILVGNRVTATVKRAHLVLNGTGLSAVAGSALTLVNSVIAGNLAVGVRLVQTDQKAFSVFHNTIDRNYSSAGVGLQVDAVSLASAFIVRNNIVTNHPIGIKVVGSVQPSHDHNDVWNDPAAGWKDYEGTTKGSGSITANPLFTGPITTTPPANTVWTSVARTLGGSISSRYGSFSETLEHAGAAWMRLRLQNFSQQNSERLSFRDRLGVEVNAWSSGFSGLRTTNAAFGSVVRLEISNGGYYTGSAVSGPGYDWAPFVYNYRLTQSSPVIDVGNTLGAPTEDADATPRPYDGDVNGTPTHDLGAYEWHENILPTAVAGPDRILLPNVDATFESAGSFDPDGRIVSWDWDFGDGTAHATTANATHKWAAVGTYTARLTVTDDQGATGTDTATVTIANNLPPTADAGADQTASIGAVVTFNGGASRDADGTIVSYGWNFGDGTPAGSGPSVTHTYARNGVFEVVLTVTDNRGATGTDTAYVVVGTTTANQKPTADAGPAKSVPLGTAVTVSGNGSTDSDGTIASYSWEWGDSTPVSTGVSATHTYTGAGSFVVTLTVTDDKGATDTDIAVVTVQGTQNRAPVADPGGPYVAQPGQQILFDGSGSGDPDGTLASYAWSFGDGTASGTTQKVAHAFTSAGSYLVRLTVTDDKGATTSDVVLASVVSSTNKAPSAKAGGPYAGNVGQAILFDASGSSDQDGSISTWHWDFGDGQSAATRQATHTYAAAGSFLARLTVTDDAGATDNDAVLVTVSQPGNTPPVARTGSIAEPLVFDAASSTDSDGTIVQWAWDFGDGGTATSQRATRAFANAGTFLVRLTVTDNRGAIGQDVALVSVGAQGNRAPVAIAGGDRKANVGQKLIFSAAGSSDPDGAIIAYQWDFGDGESAAGLSQPHTFAEGGTYTVTLIVFDNDGATGQATATVTVNAIPIADFGGERTALVGEQVTFDAGASTDSDGEIAEWRWSFHDGTLGEGRVVTHSWSKAGVYPVILQVVDDKGGRDDVSIKVTVEAPAARQEESGCATSGALPFALLGLVGLVRRRRR